MLLLLSVGSHDIDIIQKLFILLQFSSAGSCSILSNNRLLLDDQQIYTKVLDSLFNHFSQVCSLSILYLSPYGKYHVIFSQVGKIGNSSCRKDKANSETTQSYIWNSQAIKLIIWNCFLERKLLRNYKTTFVRVQS